MSTLFTIIIFVVVGPAVGVWALFELSPSAKQQDQFRNPLTGECRGESQRLD
jgi:hypothetical protein